MSCGCGGCCLKRIVQVIFGLIAVIFVVLLAYSFVYVRSLVHAEAMPLDVPVASEEACGAMLARVIRIYDDINDSTHAYTKESEVVLTPPEVNALIVLLFKESQSLVPFIPLLDEPGVRYVSRGYGEHWGLSYDYGEFNLTGSADLHFIPLATFVLDGGHVNMRVRAMPEIIDGKARFRLSGAVVGNREMTSFMRGFLERQINERTNARIDADLKVRRIIGSLHLECDENHNLVIRYRPAVLRSIITGKGGES